jgi:hypothetical protein
VRVGDHFIFNLGTARRLQLLPASRRTTGKRHRLRRNRCVPLARLQDLPGYGQWIKPDVCVRGTFPCVENGVILVALTTPRRGAA